MSQPKQSQQESLADSAVADSRSEPKSARISLDEAASGRRSAAGELSVAAIERALEGVIARLKESKERSSREIVFEAKRLKSLVGTWRSIPPPSEARREMLSRVSRLTARCPVPGATSVDHDLEDALAPHPGDGVAAPPLSSRPLSAPPLSGPRTTLSGLGRGPSINDMPAAVQPASSHRRPIPGARRPSFRELAAAAPSSDFSPDAAESVVIRTRMLPWRGVRDVDGVDVKSIRRVGNRPAVTLVRLDAGSSICIAGLAHADVFILHGDLVLDGKTMHRGDLYTGRTPQEGGPNTEGLVAQTEHGAELIITDPVGHTPWA